MSADKEEQKEIQLKSQKYSECFSSKSYVKPLFDSNLKRGQQSEEDEPLDLYCKRSCDRYQCV